MGRVRRLVDFRRHKAGLVLKPCIGSNGYAHLTLCVGGRQVLVSTHRLVLLVFVGLPPAETYTANHKNLVKTDNRLSNLEWVSRSENMKHYMRNSDWIS